MSNQRSVSFKAILLEMRTQSEADFWRFHICTYINYDVNSLVNVTYSSLPVAYKSMTSYFTKVISKQRNFTQNEVIPGLSADSGLSVPEEYTYDQGVAGC